MWLAVGMVDREDGEALGVHHTVIAIACARFQQYVTPVRRHSGSRGRATFAADDRFLVIQSWRHLLQLQPNFVLTFKIRAPCFNPNHTHTFARKWSAVEKIMYTDPVVSKSLPATKCLGCGPCWLEQDGQPVPLTDESRYYLDCIGVLE